MKIESFNSLTQPSVIEATRVVIGDKGTNNPVCCIIEFEPGQFWITTQADKNFSQALEAMHINDTVIVDQIDSKKVSQDIFLPKE